MGDVTPFARHAAAHEQDRDAVIRRGLQQTATPSERVNALMSAGLGVDDLAASVDVSENTIRNWSSGQASPRRTAEYTLDDLREAVLALTEAGLEPGRASIWLRSRNTAMLNGARPLELIRTDPQLVFDAVQHLALEHGQLGDEDRPEVLEEALTPAGPTTR